MKNELFDAATPKGYKDGIEIDKGVILNEEYLNTNMAQLGEVFAFFTAYPDIFLDLITPEDEHI